MARGSLFAARDARGGFTLVETMMAALVLALVGTGLLATAWKLTGFVREEAQRLAADAYCSDVAWAVYNQGFFDVESIPEYEVPDEALPWAEVKNAAGTVVEKRRLLRRGDDWPAPKCSVDVDVAMDGGVSNKTIVVRLEWSSAQNVRSSHEIKVERTVVARKRESSEGSGSGS